MNVLKNILGVGVLSFFFLTGVSPAADVAKIGMIDFQKILEVSEAGKTAQAEINKQGKQMETDLKDKGAEIEAIEKKIERESLLMSKDALEEKQREIRIKTSNFKAIQQRYLEDFKALENQSISRIQKEVTALVQDIGKNEGYTMIVEKRTSGAVYTPLSMDITDAVILIYNAQISNSESKKTPDTVSADLCRLVIQF
ncbi:MAG: OmpH family outer membrane protein [Deltaproteobacteria bacterium]|nr:OmpH family outer membrane protein [Deltaproteobacteria bacterium]